MKIDIYNIDEMEKVIKRNVLRGEFSDWDWSEVSNPDIIWSKWCACMISDFHPSNNGAKWINIYRDEV